MDDKDKLKAIIEKAVDCGWKCKWATTIDDILDRMRIVNHLLESIIFNHNFCKAFFGEKQLYGCTRCKTDYVVDDISECALCGWKVIIESMKNWQYHIKRLALSTNRIDYLMKFCEENKGEL